ncbi:VOC family protein [Salimicrobium flavidum]|uniref:Catechol 2,3-dioxygenase n=1 Tax=Salimicrobium flavidum TaxID=570947 RepID=A0A1N7IRY7_9BACI|nr:VOC family protein [Salimicrobium flavidum]SIS39848.1 Catechol 2,3-dioxygenase [Salimicrobium flavidum]
MLKRIDHIQLAAPVDGEDEAREFFEGALGMEEIEKPEALKKNGGVWFRFGNQQLHVGIEDPFTPAKKAHPAFEVDGLKEMMKELERKGVEVKQDDKLPGAERCYIHDPFGNRIELLEWKN